MPNESAQSFSLLSSLFGTGCSDVKSATKQLWDQTRGDMLGRTQGFIYQQDWISDFWIARGSKINAAFLTPTWEPPTALDDWPGGGQAIADAADMPSRRTNNAAFLNLLEANAAPPPASDSGAAAEFLRGEADIERDGDTRMVQGEHVRAWVSTSVGHLLIGVALTPPDATLPLTKVAIARLKMPLQFDLPETWPNEFEERRLELLYSLRFDPGGNLQQTVVHVGQGEQWREHWAWLSQDIKASDALESVRLAARLMRCPPLVEALLACLGSDDGYSQIVALAVVRRSLLTLKVMTWLEEALQHPWEFTRPQDLCCFAFNALKPEWPRRLLAISHRSADVKAILIEMRLWQSSRCAIDANYVPSWETNTGMMWGLFAAVPVIARVKSATYQNSIWCQREMEVTNYLGEYSDFMSDRWLLDVEDTRLRGLDSVSVVWEKRDENPGGEGGLFSSFPALCQVWSPRLMPEWEVKLFRAAAALRIINAFLSDVALTNSLGLRIYSGLDLPTSAPAPTNNADGWQTYAAIFRDLRSVVGNESGKLPICLPATYSGEDRLIDEELWQRIPDMSGGAYELRDLLVAIEWLRTEWPLMVQQRSGGFIVLNCQSLTKDIWSNSAELSLFRGLAAIRMPSPIWFLQLGGQEVENWPLVGERPIFTEHVATQFKWMMEMFFERRESESRYPTDSGLSLSPEVLELYAQGKPPDQ